MFFPANYGLKADKRFQESRLGIQYVTIAKTQDNGQLRNPLHFFFCVAGFFSYHYQGTGS
jgi:hypothetical protein